MLYEAVFVILSKIILSESCKKTFWTVQAEEKKSFLTTVPPVYFWKITITSYHYKWDHVAVKSGGKLKAS